MVFQNVSGSDTAIAAEHKRMRTCIGSTLAVDNLNEYLLRFHLSMCGAGAQSMHTVNGWLAEALDSIFMYVPGQPVPLTINELYRQHDEDIVRSRNFGTFGLFHRRVGSGGCIARVNMLFLRGSSVSGAEGATSSMCASTKISWSVHEHVIKVHAYPSKDTQWRRHSLFAKIGIMHFSYSQSHLHSGGVGPTALV